VLPTYNESPNIAELIDKIEALRPKLPYELMIVVVDDNSIDGTADVVKGLMQKYDNIRLIQRPRPTGLGSAYLDGFRYSLSSLKADFVGEMDADLQHPPETLLQMCDASNSGFDVVLASRYVEGGSPEGLFFTRKIISKGANVLTRIFLRLPVKDATTGFRIISAKAASALFEFELSATGYAFQVQSLYIYKKVGMNFTEVPFSFGTRKSGKTKLDRKEIFRFAEITVKTGIFGLRKKNVSRSEASSIPVAS
jgi:dolichol-phosphate mannosyltransferase